MIETVDLVDEEHVPLVQVGQDRREVAAPLDRRAAGQLDLHAQLVRDDVGERRLAEAGRAVQQDVVERLPAHLGGGDKDGEVFLHLLLPDVIGHRLGAEGVLLGVQLPFRAHDQPLVRIFVKIVKIVHSLIL